MSNALLPGSSAKSRINWAARLLVLASLAWLVLVLPSQLEAKHAQEASLAVIYAIIGLSLHLLVGYTGQISLGHQAFVGTGALVASNVASTGINRADPVSFAKGLVAAAIVGAVVALVLGSVALRITGLYLALITLVFGGVAGSAIFGIESLNGQSAGVSAVRPEFLATNFRFYYFCIVVLIGVIYIDVQLTKSKTGRALNALRENELVARAFAVDVTGYKLLAFALSGALAGLAGGLFAFRVEGFSDKTFAGVPGFQLALVFIVMVVVGGLGSRTGVIVAAAFFGLLDVLLEALFKWWGLETFYADRKAYLPGLIGSLLLLQTVVMNPRGVGQLADPILGWIRRGKFDLHAGSTVSAGSSDVRA